MPTAYYKAFPLIVVDTSGGVHYVPSETINAYNVTAASSLGTLASDSDGVIAAGSFTANVGDVVRFYHSTYPGEIRLTLRATSAEAFTDPESTEVSLILENQMVSTTASPTVQIYLADTAQPTVKPIYLGNAKSGTTTLFPYQSSIAQSARVYAVSQDELGRLATLDLAYANYQDVAISVPDRSLHCIFDHYADAPTTTTSLETLYSDTVAANQWSVNGDSIEITYHGITAANGNSKGVSVNFDGNVILNATTTANAKSWECNVSLMRANTDEIRVGVEFTRHGDSPTLGVSTITGLDLTTALDVLLQATTATASGDVTAIKGKGIFIPAAYVAAQPLEFLGTAVEFSGASVTFTS